VEAHAAQIAALRAALFDLDRGHHALAEAVTRHLAGLQAATEQLRGGLTSLQSTTERACEETSRLRAELGAELQALRAVTDDLERGQTAIASVLARSSQSEGGDR
jgi:chromosome segregation ATPase